MEGINRITNRYPGRILTPLRGPNGLLEHYKVNRPFYEKPLPTHLRIGIDKGMPIAMSRCYFYGEKVVVATARIWSLGLLDSIKADRADAAALALEQTFEGIFWDKFGDKIVAQRDGRELTLEGTNLVEAGALLPAIYRKIPSFAYEHLHGAAIEIHVSDICRALIKRKNGLLTLDLFFPNLMKYPYHQRDKNTLVSELTSATVEAFRAFGIIEHAKPETIANDDVEQEIVIAA